MFDDINRNMSLNQISCVMRSGGDFNWNDVRRLKDQLDEHLTLKFRLYVLSDQMMPQDLTTTNCEHVLLIRNWPGWWSKIELFRVFQRSFYFDLDTAIVGNINHIISFPHKFSALEGFYGRPFGSGLMAWSGDYRYIYDDFITGNPEQIMDYYKKRRMGDQEFIGARVQEPLILQDLFKDQILSYKIHVQRKLLSPKAKIICFHGKPKIHEVNEPWLDPKHKEKISFKDLSFSFL